MSIRPIDLQVMLPKTSEISKVHNDQHEKEQMTNYQQTVTTQQKANDSMKQVNSGEKTQKSNIRDKQSKNKNEKKKSNYAKGKKTSGDDETSTIDIRL